MECLTCLNLSGERPITPVPPVYRGTCWQVEHGYPCASLGWFVILPFRHVEALHELTREEFHELADIQYALAHAMGQDSSIQKEYLVCFGEKKGFAHVHFHMLARPRDLPEELRGPHLFMQQQVDRAEALPIKALQAYCEIFARRLQGLA
uniref:HIT family protein n=1 Tax=Thermosporothrix sp. COM3 TaxID=2490863 RepID=A0A455SKK6_9CHLR|nr:hypothetical protein KTC_14460 [Thermosporothrix sp. COM3]